MSSPTTFRAGTSATQLTVVLHSDASWHHHAVSDEIVRRALAAGLAGASRFRGIEGFGRTGVLHSDVDPDIVVGLPTAIVIVDPSEERIRSFLPLLDDVLHHGIATIEPAGVAFVPSRRSDSDGQGKRS